MRGACSSKRRTPPLCTATETTPAPSSSSPAMRSLTTPAGAASTAREASSAARTRLVSQVSWKAASEGARVRSSAPRTKKAVSSSSRADRPPGQDRRRGHLGKAIALRRRSCGAEPLWGRRPTRFPGTARLAFQQCNWTRGGDGSSPLLSRRARRAGRRPPARPGSGRSGAPARRRGAGRRPRRSARWPLPAPRRGAGLSRTVSSVEAMSGRCSASSPQTASACSAWGAPMRVAETSRPAPSGRCSWAKPAAFR